MTDARPSRARRGLSRKAGITIGVLLTLLASLLAAAGVAIVQNEYDLREKKVVITGGATPLHGVLALPEQGRGPYGLVVFVHGDGPIDATHEGFYRPMWESLAKAGYASLSWNKPGVGGAPGDWLRQSMDDRAAEVSAAIDWAKGRPDIDARRIGLWGASQAGWVMPKVAARTPDLHFVIAVSPAVNWLRQGRYNLLAELRARHASPGETKAEIARSDTIRRLLREGADFGRLQASGVDLRDMTAARWGFVSKNLTTDAGADLAAMAARSAGRTPVLLLLGGHDLNVDVAETETVYRRLLNEPGKLQVVRYPGATHSMVREEIETSDWRLPLYAIFAPRSLFVPGYLTDLSAFLQRLDRRP